ncbi:MAG: tRNA uridine-5-carboxymethylaminomethyl(34) synthesis GTPase MnmE [Candidatus Binatales bacterium]
MYVEDTIVAPVTPPGTGAVAIVRLSGPEAIRIMRAIWRPLRPRAALRAHTLHLGEVRNPATGASIDRALGVVMPAPKSLTGEDVAELHCHGGAYLVRRVIALAMAHGARMAEPGEFSRRAFLNGRMDLTEAEAIADLIAARSDSALEQAITQLGGALAECVGRLRAGVIGIRAHLEAEIDFADEDVNLPSREQIGAAIADLAADIRVLHDSFARGRLMREGARATIVGKPNVGKSSILNLLLGAERAIVTPIPGTTRDVIEDSISLGPYTLVLQDTAGIRDGAVRDDAGEVERIGQVERIGIERTLQHAAQAELVLAVFDSSRPLEAEDLRVIELCRGRRGVAVLNKRDLPAVLSDESLRDVMTPALATSALATPALAMPVLSLSALKAEGVAALRNELQSAVEALAGETDRRGGASEGIAISRERHRQALATALEALERAGRGALSALPPEVIAVDVALAAEALGAITGAVGVEDVLDAVFREFCIGK